MGKGRLYLITFFISAFLLVPRSSTPAHDGLEETFAGNEAHRVYRAGPSDEELRNESDLERLKEEKAWDMLRNLILDVNRDFTIERR
ncbi:hypothetical protein [Thermodesulforhabdus norvegica]|uniref:Uncharacterized protein n=1 Tax=Thermodesulforhabdus norvegica TaxID=39841 RepID=A0A1I4QRX3_9BACT|nr:hypothetical protein [Thermodesulforhabdus norvegica]SFM42781.1 hypothetical protein SAMN05660836_00192 [Thermodesulforhabdus norvegica]